MGAIVVTGCARTGTSLTMQTLALLGIPVVGDKWSEQFSDRELHPRGCYDLPVSETIGGIHGEKYDGKGIKLFGYPLSLSSPSAISRVLVCVRERSATLASIVRMLESPENTFGVPATRETAERMFQYHYATIWRYLDSCHVPHMRVHFEDFVTRPEAVVRSIADFVGASGPIAGAVDNVITRG